MPWSHIRSVQGLLGSVPLANWAWAPTLALNSLPQHKHAYVWYALADPSTVNASPTGFHLELLGGIKPAHE